MNKRKYLLLGTCLGLFFLTNLAAQKIAQPKLSPSEWWTAPYLDVFSDADIIYALNPQKAYQILDIIIQRSSNEKQIKVLYKSYYTKGLYLERQLSFQSALNNYVLASKTVEKTHRALFADVQIDIAIMYRNLYRYTDARSTYFSLIEHCIQHRDSANLLNAYGGLGVLFFTVNDYDNAIRYYDKALQKARETHNYVNECIYLDNLSEAYGCRKEYNKAFEHIKLACSIAEREKDLDSQIPLYERHARLYADVGDFDRALVKIDAALDLCKGDDYIRDRNNLTIAKADLYLTQKDNDAALNTFKTINEKLINVNSLTKVYFEFGKIYEQKREWILAETYFEKSRQLADNNKSLRYSEWSHRALYRIFRMKNQASEALTHLELANTLRDSLFNYEKSGQVTELQFHYDLAQSDQKLQEAQMAVNRNMMFMGFLVALLIISVLVFSYYWLRKQNEVLTVKNEAIREQKEQLELFNLEILAKNKANEAQKRQLEESNRMMQQFNYAVAHDLKEPLRNISSFATLIQRRFLKDMPPVAAEYFEFVMSGSIRMGKMLEGLLKYSMLSIDQVTDLEDVDLNAIVNEVSENLRVVVEEKKAQIIYANPLPHVFINRIHITQLIQNLVSNGIKFVEGKPVVEIGSREENNHILLFVRDNGIGIQEDSGKKLFNLFHRLHRDATKFEGTGVGLAVCKNIVEKYGGRIWFESIESQGTTFFIQFPKEQASLN
jgi:signal transduction histidine kinase